MGKTLHLFMLLALFFLAGGGISANAAEEDLTATSTGFTSKISKIEFAKNGGSTAPAWISTSSEYRLYAQGTLTITPNEGITITKVEYTFKKNKNKKGKVPTAKLSSTEGTFTVTDAGATWEGTTTKAIVLLANGTAGNFGFTALKITYDNASSGKTATKVTFEKGDYTVKQDADATDLLSYTNVATVKDADGNPIDGATVTYSSSDKDHADVDANGKVTIDPTTAGTYTITASYAGDDTYASSSAIYTITVQEDLGLTGAGTEADPYTVADALKILNKKKEAEFGKSVYVKGTISRVVSTTPHETYGSLNYDISDDGQDENFLYVFGGLKKGSVKFTSASEIAVGDIVLLKGDLQTYVKQNTPELNSNNTLEKFYERPETFDETSTESTVAAGHNVTATLKRTFNDNAWNTLVLPFDLTAEQIAAAFGADAKVAAYTGATAGADGTYTLNFKEATTITANTPVFIHSAQNNADGYTFTGVEVKNATPTQTADGFNFVGTYTATTVPVGNYFINSSNKFFKAGDDKTNIKGTRATFEPVGAATSAKGLGFNVTEDGTTTAINSITMQEELNVNAPMYNLAGQQVTKAYKGVILQNGKKFINK